MNFGDGRTSSIAEMKSGYCILGYNFEYRHDYVSTEWGYVT